MSKVSDFSYLWDGSSSNWVLVEDGGSRSIYNLETGTTLLIEDELVMRAVQRKMIDAACEILPGPPDSLLRCPVCGSWPDSRGLLLRGRQDDGARTCQALYECEACGSRLWRWLDREDALVLWTEDFWPTTPPDEWQPSVRHLP